MEKMFASGDFGSPHFLVTDGAHVVQIRQFIFARFWKAFDFVNSRPPLHEDEPTDPRLAPGS